MAISSGIAIKFKEEYPSNDYQIIYNNYNIDYGSRILDQSIKKWNTK